MHAVIIYFLLRQARFFFSRKRKSVREKLHIFFHGHFHTFRDLEMADHLSRNDSGLKHDWLFLQPCWNMTAIHQPFTSPSTWTITSHSTYQLTRLFLGLLAAISACKQWTGDNPLLLNVEKSKEIVIDYRRKGTTLKPLCIQDRFVESFPRHWDSCVVSRSTSEEVS